MEYELVYDRQTGNVSSIKRLSDSAFIPLAQGNSDFQSFLIWNAQQPIPLDLESTIKIVTPEPKVAEVFDIPVIAPDFIVQSPKPKSNHLEAHAEAIAESKKANKSIALIVLDLIMYIEELEKRLQKNNI